MVAAMLTLPVAGTALYLADQHLHPRNRGHGTHPAGGLADPGRQALAGGSAAAAGFVLHPIMAALGISFCFFLTMALLEPVHVWLRSLREFRWPPPFPLGWIFESPTPIWRKALDTRTYFFLYQLDLV